MYCITHYLSLTTWPAAQSAVAAVTAAALLSQPVLCAVVPYKGLLRNRTPQKLCAGGMLSKRLCSSMKSAHLAVKFRSVTFQCAALGTVTSAYLESSTQVALQTRKLIVLHADCEESFFYRVSIIDRLDSNILTWKHSWPGHTPAVHWTQRIRKHRTKHR